MIDVRRKRHIIKRQILNRILAVFQRLKMCRVLPINFNLLSTPQKTTGLPVELHFLTAGIPRSLQILFAKKASTSLWRGTLEVLFVFRL